MSLQEIRKVLRHGFEIVRDENAILLNRLGQDSGLGTGFSEGFLAAHVVTTIHYLLRKEMGNIKARRIVSAILSVLGVATVDAAVVQEALRLPLTDFEYAVTAAAARLTGCECIVTRDPKRFRGSLVRALPPEAVIPLLDKM